MFSPDGQGRSLPSLARLHLKLVCCMSAVAIIIDHPTPLAGNLSEVSQYPQTIVLIYDSWESTLPCFPASHLTSSSMLQSFWTGPSKKTMATLGSAMSLSLDCSFFCHLHSPLIIPCAPVTIVCVCRWMCACVCVYFLFLETEKPLQNKGYSGPLYSV